MQTGIFLRRLKGAAKYGQGPVPPHKQRASQPVQTLFPITRQRAQEQVVCAFLVLYGRTNIDRHEPRDETIRFVLCQPAGQKGPTANIEPASLGRQLRHDAD